MPTSKKKKKYNTDKRLARLIAYIKRIYGVTIRNIEDLLIFFDEEYPPPERLKHLPEINRTADAVALLLLACDSKVKTEIFATCNEIYTAIAEETADLLGVDITDLSAFKQSLTLNGDISEEVKAAFLTAAITGQDLNTQIVQLAQRRANSWANISRTEATRAENAARYNVGLIAQEQGLTVWKRWEATQDTRTRETHAEKNGEELPLESLFTFPDGSQMLYPADDTHGATLAEIINCRCRLFVFNK